MICEQCGVNEATVYAADPDPGGWGGRYCQSCCLALGFLVLDRELQEELTDEQKISALMAEGGYDDHEARAMLIDMGEIEED
jgi:hypothetical protein